MTYNPKYTTLEDDIYRMCVIVARSYYSRIRRQREIDEDVICAGRNPPGGMPRGNQAADDTAQRADRLLKRKAENERKIKAVGQAWVETSRDDTEREFIRLNLLLGITFMSVALPMSRKAMKNTRKRFLVALAENLNEI